jgi:hypothetical protein
MADKRNRIIIIAGGKGGVGKSFFAQNLLAWYQSLGTKVIVFDGDPENNTLTRFTKVSRPLDMRQRNQIDNLINVVASGEATHVVLDCQAATSTILQEWFRELDLPSIEKHVHTRFTIVSLITQSVDTLLQTIRWTGHYGKNVQWLAAKNLYLNPDFKQWDSSVLRKKFIEELEGMEVSIPAIPDFLMTPLETGSLSISAATQSEQMTWMDKQRLLGYQNHLFEQFKAASDVLL